MGDPLLGPLLESIQGLFLDSYDRQSLRELLRFKMDQRLEHIVADGANLRAIVFDVLEQAEREGWLLYLAREARDRRRDRKPEWVGVVAELEAVLQSAGDLPRPVPRSPARLGRQVVLADCPHDVLIALTQQLVAAAGAASRGEPVAVQVTLGDWNVRVDVNLAAFGTWGATAGLDSIGRQVAGHRRQIDYYQKQKLGPFAAGVDYDQLIGEQSAALTAALEEMANRLRPFVQTIWRTEPSTLR
jgi:hypothetical protein